MTLDDIQKQVDDWARQFNPPYWQPLSQLARMTEEVGELAREMNHVHGDKKKKSSEKESSIGDELADILFTASCIANREGLSLQEYWDKLMKEKQYGRDKDRFEKS